MGDKAEYVFSAYFLYFYRGADCIYLPASSADKLEPHASYDRLLSHLGSDGPYPFPRNVQGGNI